MMRRAAILLAAPALALVLAGCGSEGDPSTKITSDTLTIYTSLPLRGTQAEVGRAGFDGGRRLGLADLEQQRLALRGERIELGLEALDLVAGAGDPARLGQVQGSQQRGDDDDDQRQ